MNSHPKIAEYVAAAPDEQQGHLKWIRKLMRTNLDGVANERCEPGMVVYGLEKRWLTGFAWRKKCAMFYVMDSKLLDRYEERLGKLRSGKSCVEFRETAAMKMADLKLWAEEVMEEVRKQA